MLTKRQQYGVDRAYKARQFAIHHLFSFSMKVSSIFLAAAFALCTSAAFAQTTPGTMTPGTTTTPSTMTPGTTTGTMPNTTTTGTMPGTPATGTMNNGTMTDGATNNGAMADKKAMRREERMKSRGMKSKTKM